MILDLSASPDFHLFVDNDDRQTTLNIYTMREAHDRFYINARVTGFWSDDTARLLFEWNIATRRWEARFTHSAGGRLSSYDPKRPDCYPLSDDLEAEAALGRTLVYLSHLGALILQLLNQPE